jgi:hypothetical protein
VETLDAHLKYLYEVTLSDKKYETISKTRFIYYNLSREFGDYWREILKESDYATSVLNEILQQGEKVLEVRRKNTLTNLQYKQICAILDSKTSKLLFEQQSSLVRLEDGVMIVKCKSPNLLRQMAKGVKDLELAASKKLGYEVKVRVVI